MNKGSALQKAVVILALCTTLFVPLREILACTIGHEMAVGDYGDNACHELPASLAGDCLTADHNQCIQHCAATLPLEVTIKGQKTPVIKAVGISPDPVATFSSPITLSKLRLASQDRTSVAVLGPLFGASILLITHRLRL